MTDKEFLGLDVAEARAAWLEGATAKERERLHSIYAERHNINLSSGAAALAEMDSNDGASEGASDMLSSAGWLMLIVGAGAGIGGALADYPIVWLIGLGSAGMSAGFFCILFGYIGKKLDRIADILKP